jgi:hypothetical protein
MTVYAIVFLRIAFGLWMLYHEAWEKLHTWTPQTLPRIIGMWAKNPEVAGFYRSFLQDVAAPNAGFFRGLVTAWELVFALSLRPEPEPGPKPTNFESGNAAGSRPPRLPR